MTDQLAGARRRTADAAEERLPATRPAATQLSAERFTAAPPIKANAGLTPGARGRDRPPVRRARAGSASSRSIIVSLFIVGYCFYELGAPLGLSQPRLAAEEATPSRSTPSSAATTCSRRTAPAATARTASAEGAGCGDGRLHRPALNDQEKLFAHLNAQYIQNVLSAGGRYVCGNPNSQMPVWSNQGNPPRAAELPPDRRR